MPDPQPQLVSTDPHWGASSATPEASESALSRFASGAWKNLNPMGLVRAALHPGDAAKALIDAQTEQLDKAKAMYDQGRYSEAIGHLAGGVLPIVGPAAANAGERIGSGDIAGGLGEATGLLASVEAPRAVGAVTKAVVPPAAAALGSVKGIAPDVVGLVSPRGAHVLRIAQKLAERTKAGQPIGTLADLIEADPRLADMRAVRDAGAGEMTPLEVTQALKPPPTAAAAPPETPIAAPPPATPAVPSAPAAPSAPPNAAQALLDRGVGVTDAERQAMDRLIQQGVSPEDAQRALAHYKANPPAPTPPAAASPPPPAPASTSPETSPAALAAAKREVERMMANGKTYRQALNLVQKQLEMASRLGATSEDAMLRAVRRRVETGRWE